MTGKRVIPPTEAVRTAKPRRRRSLGRTARLLTLRPPLAYGGHAFAFVGHDLARCHGCHVMLPWWAVAEGMGQHFGLARWCPALFEALTTGSG